MKILFVLFLLGFSTLALAESCPRHEGKFPTAIVDLGEYKLFYFTPSSTLYSEQGQAATVYLTKGGNLFGVDTAEGGADWYSFMRYVGKQSEFSCDSVALDFNSAWIIDENGQLRTFKQGEVRAPGYGKHDLACADGW